MLGNRAMLVAVNISQWTGRKTDKKATSTVEVSHATKGKVGNYTKKLLPGAPELERVSRIASSIRKWVYCQTLPWLADGTRILSNRNYSEFNTEFRKRQMEFEQAVSEFLNSYEGLKTDARGKLGQLFNEGEYLSDSRLRNRFHCEVTYLPLPSSTDFRIEVDPAQKSDLERKIREVETKAIAEVWNRLFEVVTTAKEKLSDPKATFRESLFGNIREVCELLPKLNVTDDPNLESARQKLVTALDQMDPDLCRKDANERQSARDQLNGILNAMGAFYDPKKQKE
jgi:hypothetical protein